MLYCSLGIGLISSTIYQSLENSDDACAHHIMSNVTKLSQLSLAVDMIGCQASS